MRWSPAIPDKTAKTRRRRFDAKTQMPTFQANQKIEEQKASTI